MTDEADPLDRTIRVEGWVDSRPAEIVFVVHSDQVTIVCGEGRTVEIHAPVWRLLSMRIAVLLARLGFMPDRS